MKRWSVPSVLTLRSESFWLVVRRGQDTVVILLHWASHHDAERLVDFKEGALVPDEEQKVVSYDQPRRSRSVYPSPES
jgi:hypothetical protein